MDMDHLKSNLKSLLQRLHDRSHSNFRAEIGDVVTGDFNESRLGVAARRQARHALDAKSDIVWGIEEGQRESPVTSLRGSQAVEQLFEQALFGFLDYGCPRGDLGCVPGDDGVLQPRIV